DEAADRPEIGEVELHQFDRGGRLRGRDRFEGTPALRLIPTRQDDVRPFCNELTRRLVADPAVGTRDDDGSAGLWRDVVCGPGHQDPGPRRPGGHSNTR